MNKQKFSFDEQIEKINKKIAKLLGKKDSNPENNLSNVRFIVLLIINVLFLWGITGFYFVNSNQYAIFYKNGKIINIVKGVKIGLTYPIPFGNYQLINANLENTLSIGSETGELWFSSDLKPFKVNVIFNYKINNIKTFYDNFGFVEDINKLIFLLFNVQLREYIAFKDSSLLVHDSLIAQSNDFRDILNKRFEVYGISISKLYFKDLSIADNENNSKEYNVIKEYKHELNLFTSSMKNNKIVAKDELNGNKYPLLKLDLENLKKFYNSEATNVKLDENRNSNREVVRERVFR